MKLSAGLIIIQNNKILLCHPTGRGWWGTYSIPKGEVEEGEDLLDAAIRETEEETGIKVNVKYKEPDGYIDYKDENGNARKRVFYFVVKLNKQINIDKSKLQIEEVDWAGLLELEEAKKRIYWRLKPLLKYIEKEHIDEKFVENSDPIKDMGIGMMSQIEKFVKSTKYSKYKSKEDYLWICADAGKLDFVRYLIEKGVSVGALGERALRWAVIEGHTEVVKLLIKAGANIHTVDEYPLIAACTHGHYEIVKVLLEAGANAYNDEALSIALLSKYYKIVELLKKHRN